MQPIARRHIPELDGLRGVAALAVVGNHLAETYQSRVQGPGLHSFLNLLNVGFVGVDVFFALSGFLITSILLEKRGTQHFYRNFYARRVLRLAPAYLLTLLLVFLLIPGSGPYLLISLVYLANMAPLLHITATYGLLWSLSVEEHFYLLWPWLVRWLRPPALGAICVALCLGTPVARLVAAHAGALNPMLTWYRLDGLAWGALLALLLHCRPATWVRGWARAMLVAGSGVCLAGLLIRELQRVAGDSILNSGAAMLSSAVIAFAVTRAGEGRLALLRARPLRVVGDVSYWLYLTHYLALAAGLELLKHWPRLLAHAGWGVFLGAAGSTVLPTLLTGLMVRRWIELPVLRLKSRFASPVALPAGEPVLP